MLVDIFKYVLLVLGIYFVYDLLTHKYLNPYKLYMVMGKKGSGKTTLLTRLAVDFLNKGWHVYSTEPINVEGVRHFDVNLVGRYTFEHNSLVLIDEVGMIWDNRDFVNFAKSVRNWFKLQRHYKCYVYLFSQCFDIDKKLRDLTDGMYTIECKFRVFSWAKRIHREFGLTQATDERESRIADNLKYDSLLSWPSGGRKLTFIPKYSKYFDSHCVPFLPPMPYEVMVGPQPMYADEVSRLPSVIFRNKIAFIKKWFSTPAFGLAVVPVEVGVIV